MVAEPLHLTGVISGEDYHWQTSYLIYALNQIHRRYLKLKIRKIKIFNKKNTFKIQIKKIKLKLKKKNKKQKKKNKKKKIKKKKKKKKTK